MKSITKLPKEYNYKSFRCMACDCEYISNQFFPKMETDLNNPIKDMCPNYGHTTTHVKK